MGKRPETARGRPHTLAPVLVLGATDDMAIMQEEIFGPLLPVVAHATIDDTIAYVNAHPRPLALYYFGGDNADRRKVLLRTTSGNVGINNALIHYAQDDLPFGGVGASGIGAYHGIEGFRSMSHAKGIYVLGRWNVSDLMRAPFGRVANAMDDAAVVEIRISSCERPGEIFTAPHNWVGGDKPFATTTATHRRRR